MDPKLRAILREAATDGGTPVVMVTRKGEPLWVVMPFHVDNSRWLRGNRARRRGSQEFVRGPFVAHWRLPKSWLSSLVLRFVERFGACYVVQALRTKETCAPACWNAKGIVCECACMGVHHGEESPGRWYVVSDTYAFSWGPRQLHYKLLKKR